MAKRTIASALSANFLGHSPDWYKLTIIGFLIANPLLMMSAGPFITGWVLILEFIFCLAMALKCYPLQPGGLLALEAVMMGLTTTDGVYHEIVQNFPVILLLMFMVAGIYFLKELLLFGFTKLLLRIESKPMLSLTFCMVAAVLSAFLDALTVTAVVITVAHGFYLIYHKVASGKQYHSEHDVNGDDEIDDLDRSDLDVFRGFLRSLMMHAVVGTALGGVSTMVGEPQNLLIAKTMGWDFQEFFTRVLPVSFPVLLVGLATCVLVERMRWFSFGDALPAKVRQILNAYDEHESEQRSAQAVAMLWVQGLVVILLVTALAFHLAEVGIIGLTVIILATAFNGVTEEHQLGRAFTEAMPFTSLLVVFFAIVAVIHDQHLFQPLIQSVLALDGTYQTAALYLVNGGLSAISDNVFVATVYITEVQAAFAAGDITREQFDRLAVAINAGTNLASVTTPNGQAAFLFLLTSALAPLIRLSYGRMVYMALPYAITLSISGLLAVVFLLP
jgi:Na+:H+ antiporter, NhaB family